MLKKARLSVLICCCLSGTACFSQPVHKEKTIHLKPIDIINPVYYQNNGYTTVFEASDLLDYDTLKPLLNKYDMLQYTQDSVWVNNIVNLEVYDSTYAWQSIRLRSRMNYLFEEGRIKIINKNGKNITLITLFSEEYIPIVGTNYYYSEKKKSSKIFEYFKVYIGCPDF